MYNYQQTGSLLGDSANHHKEVWMARKTGSKPQKSDQTNGATLGFETELWATANALRGSMDAAEYLPAPHSSQQERKHILSGGLIDVHP